MCPGFESPTFNIAPSPNGKAQEFDSCIYWFESSRGSLSQEKRGELYERV